MFITVTRVYCLSDLYDNRTAPPAQSASHGCNLTPWLCIIMSWMLLPFVSPPPPWWPQTPGTHGGDATARQRVLIFRFMLNHHRGLQYSDSTVSRSEHKHASRVCLLLGMMPIISFSIYIGAAQTFMLLVSIHAVGSGLKLVLDPHYNFYWCIHNKSSSFVTAPVSDCVLLTAQYWK